MDRLSYYIEKQYGNDPKWFQEEVIQGNHAKRINDVINNRDYLAGKHKVLLRQDSQYKGKTLVVNKTVINYAKTVIKFHNTYLLGKPVQLSCNDENTLKTFSDIYKLGHYAIKLYLDNLKQFLNDVACMPSVLGSSTNIANISEVSMQILLMLASVNADENKKWLDIGFKERFRMFQKILNMQGIKIDSDVDVIYNVSMPVASTEMIANLKALQEMGAISRETIMEKTEYITDVDVEKKRLSGENVSQNVSQNGDESVDNPSKDVGNE